MQFVVIALIANTRGKADSQAINAFGTPNVVHFAGALTISAIMTAPWPSLLCTTIATAFCGIAGLLYSAIVCRRAGHQTAYQPVLEDWFFYAILPCAIYATLWVAAFFLQRPGAGAQFTIAAIALGLLLLGVRNAWDSVTHTVANRGGDDVKKTD